MKSRRCSLCGGQLEVEGESWRKGSGDVYRTLRCQSCGVDFDSRKSWPHSHPPSDHGSARPSSYGRLALVCIAFLALWFLLRAMDFERVRVNVYAWVSRGAEGFLHPGWAIALAVLAIGFFLLFRRSAETMTVQAAVAPAVQIRAEPAGKLTVMISESRDAVAHDAVVDRDPGEERRVVQSFRAIARRTAAFERDRLNWSREEIEETQRELYALGLSVGRTMLGRSGGVAESLTNLPGDHLQLGVQAELSDIPWELIVPRKGGRYLWQHFSVTRQLRDGAVAARGGRQVKGPRRLLLLANLESGEPGRDLPAAEHEAGEMLELGATRPDMLRVVRKSPRTSRELEQLLSEGYDIVHFASHTAGDVKAGGGWILSSEETVSPAELLAHSENVPSLVFANACSSGTDLGAGGTGGSARALMLAGVPAYMCTLAELHDGGSAAFSLAFYRALLRGNTFGMAVTAARDALMGRHPFTWANYVLYGDPTLKLD